MPIDPLIRWFSWGTTVVVVRGGEAFSVGKRGWIPVNSADVLHDTDARSLSEADARKIFADDFDMFGEPPIATPG